MIIGGPALTKYNDRSLKDLTTTPAAAGGNTGALVLIKTLTASSSGTLSFVNGADSVVLDSTYPIYKFEFIDIHGSADDTFFQVNFRDGSTAYDATKTSTIFRAYHFENDGGNALQYQSEHDLAQSTGVLKLVQGCGSDNDMCTVGTLTLYDPSNTTFVKHFIARTNTIHASDRTYEWHVAGYCNTTSAIDGAQFSFASGNIDSGTIKLYGVK